MHAHILINNGAHCVSDVANFQEEVLSRNMMGRIITTIQAHPFLWVIATSACRKSPLYPAYQDDFIVYHFHTISQYYMSV